MSYYEKNGTAWSLEKVSFQCETQRISEVASQHASIAQQGVCKHTLTSAKWAALHAPNMHCEMFVTSVCTQS